MKTFTYLGSTLAEDGEQDAEVTQRVQSGWKNRRTGRECLECCATEKMNVKIKGKVYRTVVRLSLMYGARTRTGQRYGH